MREERGNALVKNENKILLFDKSLNSNINFIQRNSTRKLSLVNWAHPLSPLPVLWY